MKVRFGDLLSGDFNPVVTNVIVHGCNSHGIMGSGIAAQIKVKWPNVFDAYHEEINSWDSGKFGSILGTVIWAEAQPQILVANAITQEHFGRDKKKYVSYQAISDSFFTISREAKLNNWHVHFPMIGAVLGGGDWAVISDVIRARFEEVDYEEYTLWIQE